jgi:hypothetical protein
MTMPSNPAASYPDALAAFLFGASIPVAFVAVFLATGASSIAIGLLAIFLRLWARDRMLGWV